MSWTEPQLAVAKPRAWPIYYGWVNVLVASLSMSATLPGRTHGLGLITKPLLDDMRLDEGTFSAFNLWANLGGALLAWPTGWLIDRLGTRFVGSMVTVALGGAVLAMSEVRTPLLLFASLLMVRGLGQGALSVASMAMVSKWFTGRLGLAMGVYSVLLGIGFIAGTLIVGTAVGDHGWRIGWRGLGWGIVALGAATWLFVRSTPESCGRAPVDSGPRDERKTSDATLTEALSSAAFWTYSIAAASFGLIWSAITLFNEPILNAHGFGRDDFMLVMTILAGTGLVSNMLAGWALSYWPMGRIMGIGMVILAIAVGAFPMIRGQGALVAYAVALGMAGGVITVVYFTFYGRAYGRTHLGLIQGAAHLLSTIASALGPVALTWCHAQIGSYDGMFLSLAPVTAILGLAAWAVPLPKPAADDQEGRINASLLVAAVPEPAVPSKSTHAVWRE